MTVLRVLVVDDSALMRKMIPQILARDPAIEVVGTAMDGVFALKKIREMKPDVVTLDVNMPRMDGIETLRHIVTDFGIPVVIVSSLARQDADLTLQALEIGAFDFVTKPQDAISVHINEIAQELIAKVRAAGGNRGSLTVTPRMRPLPAKKPSCRGRRGRSSPSASPRAGRTRSAICCRSCPRIFPRAS